MLFGETVAVYCENHTEHTDKLCGENVEFWCVKACGTYSNHLSLKGYTLPPLENFLFSSLLFFALLFSLSVLNV
jgi:hypothetical protein